jgi:hypothetical protein
MTVPNLPATDAAILDELVRATQPFLKIKGADRIDWRRVMQDPKNGRNGPWKWRARYDVLDESTWSRDGEALYLVVDCQGTVRMVGQTTDCLKTRWKEVPMYRAQDKVSMGCKGLFHTTGWPAIEAVLDQSETKTYTVAAIFRSELDAVCRRVGGPLATALQAPETKHRKLSYHVETWICGLKQRGLPLWNKQKT